MNTKHVRRGLWGTATALSLLLVSSLLLAGPASRPTSRPSPAVDFSNIDTDKLSRQQVHQIYFDVMKKELQRNWKNLRTRKKPRVYYMRYQMQISRSVALYATDGAIKKVTDRRKNPFRRINVDLRVGNYKFDHTGREGRDYKIYRPLLPVRTFLPQEFSQLHLSKLFWQNTDREYRIAFGSYWRKKYVRSIKPKKKDHAGDFTRESPTVYLAPLTPKFTFNKKHWKGVLRRVSAFARRDTNVISAYLSIQGSDNVVLGVASDGSRVRLRDHSYNWSIRLTYLSEKEKEYFYRSDSGYAESEKKLPSEQEFQRKAALLLKDLREEARALEGDPDEGPAIVDPQIAGAMFYDILMLRLEAQRFLRDNDERAFAKKLGQPIIPTFLTIVDDPTVSHWKGTPLSSHYLYDDEWVRGRRKVMIAQGVLQQFFLSRRPYKQFKHSTGNGRASFGRDAFSRPSTTFVRSTRAYPLPQLKKMLAQEIRRQGKRYGYMMKKFLGNSYSTGSTYRVRPLKLYRLDIKTGKLERLKGLRVQTSPISLIQSIVATGDDYSVFNGSDSENSGTVSVATVAPSLLVRSITLNRIRIKKKKEFQIPPPFKPKKVNLSKLLGKPRVRPVCPSRCPEICRCPVCQKERPKPRKPSRRPPAKKETSTQAAPPAKTSPSVRRATSRPVPARPAPASHPSSPPRRAPVK